MAPFSRRQTAYIRAVADQGKHTTYVSVVNRPETTSLENYDDSLTGGTAQAHCKYRLYCLGELPKVWDAGAADTSSVIADGTVADAVTSLNCFQSQFKVNSSNTTDINDNQLIRGTGEVFLDKTTLNFRCLFDPKHFDDTANARHGEFRFIVFRHKEKQSGDVRFAQNMSNPLYDLFLEPGNQKVGIKGVRQKITEIGNDDYVALNGSFNEASALLTAMINKEDYIVMKDVRFFLGPRFGKSHYETRIEWNWNTVLDCSTVPDATDVDVTEQADHPNNFKWYALMIGTRLHGSGDAEGGSLLNIRVSGTTTMKSQ
jgi:hypothetical protein